MKNRIFIVLMMGMIILASCGYPKNKINDAMDQIILKTKNGPWQISVKKAETPEAQARGLMGVASLGENEGMFFIYQKPHDDVAFWMKNMKISLDILFISPEFKVVHIAKEVPPCQETVSPCPLYRASEPVQYVLEVAAGAAERHGVGVGDAMAVQQ